jgi:Ser/Thr protein kinase RdoA (MazF antagonist)
LTPTAGRSSADEARQIAASCGISASSIRLLSTGAQSEVWLVEAGSQRHTLRIDVSRVGETSSYESEFAIRGLLADLGGQVARPLFTNRDVAAFVDRAWSVDEYVEGRPAGREEITPAICRELGELLARLHNLPVEGFGLLQNHRDRLVGSVTSPKDGFLSRLDRPWPFTGQPIQQHPIAAAAPDLVERLESLEPELLELARPDQTSVPLHTDLHHGQILLYDGRLAALLDFGDATAGPPAWDVASFAYFHGWNAANLMLEGYTEDQRYRDALIADGRRFAVVLALHHAGRAGPLNQPQRMDGAVRYLATHL